METGRRSADHAGMTRLTLIPKPPTAKGDHVRRYFIVRLPPKYEHLRKAHD